MLSGPKRSRSRSVLSGSAIAIIIILIVTVAFFSIRNSNNDSYENNPYGTGNEKVIRDPAKEYNYETRVNDVNAADYLAMYDRNSMKYIKPANVKTGENPFDTLFVGNAANVKRLPGKDVTFINKTPYDIVLMEHAGKLAFNRASYAYFIESGKKVKLQVTNQGAVKQEYSFYFGNDLASFEAGEIQIKRRDLRDEFRFRKLVPYCRAIMDKKFRFSNDVTIENDGVKLMLKSQGLKGVTDSLTTQNEYTF
jgi:hypothetical protein